MLQQMQPSGVCDTVSRGPGVDNITAMIQCASGSTFEPMSAASGLFHEIRVQDAILEFRYVSPLRYDDIIIVTANGLRAVNTRW